MKSTIGVFLAVIAIGILLCSTTAEWVCQPGVPYKENECNNCTCSESNKLVCGDKGCLDPIESFLFNCQVGTITEKDCNRCECIKDIGTVCTNKICET
ncbi:hypothetical protein ILUMI_17533 [Ignelater luminosus]|uniref:Protease inhibitor n=1 Tax=Ignelater luminosus TaxID=2038154 RepID=A0A8K0CS39_IGNLU|nr:hypothetical protein ILUMI_17533 [Ignelater luminosus]